MRVINFEKKIIAKMPLFGFLKQILAKKNQALVYFDMK